MIIQGNVVFPDGRAGLYIFWLSILDSLACLLNQWQQKPEIQHLFMAIIVCQGIEVIGEVGNKHCREVKLHPLGIIGPEYSVSKGLGK